MRRVVWTLGLVCLTATFASARTWYILPDGTGDAPTIQAGIDSAAIADTVLVAEVPDLREGEEDTRHCGLADLREAILGRRTGGARELVDERRAQLVDLVPLVLRRFVEVLQVIDEELVALRAELHFLHLVGVRLLVVDGPLPRVDLLALRLPGRRVVRD